MKINIYHLFLVLLLSNTLRSQQLIKKLKTIVIVDSSTYQHTHSIFFNDLRSKIKIFIFTKSKFYKPLYRKQLRFRF